MSRLLEFRLWLPDEQVLTRDYLIWESEFREKLMCWVNKEPVVLQFTGVLDRNDNKVFEGDLLFDPANPKDIFIVEYLSSEFVFRGLKFKASVCFVEQSLEVIGNRYTNTELLTHDITAKPNHPSLNA